MLGQSLERLPAGVEPVEIGIWRLEPGHQANAVGIVVEPAGVRQRGLERAFPGMAERRMAEVVGEAQGLGQILVEAKRSRDGPTDLGDLDAVREPDPEMIAVR